FLAPLLPLFVRKSIPCLLQPLIQQARNSGKEEVKIRSPCLKTQGVALVPNCQLPLHRCANFG
ncbi:hypothetical protein, partial [Microcoleus sp. N9_A1]|uniref:hypothetical protein n=1 Tax=Microcoleus sp. N9_A1 TaxID=3055380 RepID=UPI002FD61FED